MIFQFGIVALGVLCGTILAIAGQPDMAKFVVGGCALVFVMSRL